jgi:hypothetical protein
MILCSNKKRSHLAALFVDLFGALTFFAAGCLDV